MNWRGFIVWLLGTTAVVALVIYLFQVAARAQPKLQLAEKLTRIASLDCGKRDEISAALGLLNETVRATGMQGNTIVQLWYSPGGRTWTLLLITESGLACLLGSGENWFGRH